MKPKDMRLRCDLCGKERPWWLLLRLADKRLVCKEHADYVPLKKEV